MKLLSSNVYDHHRKIAVTRNKEFEKKHLATHSADVGFLCDHGCTYCSTPSTIWQQSALKETGMTSQELFVGGYAVIDTDTPNRIPATVKHLTLGDIVMLCPKTDGWSPVSQQYGLGGKVLEAVLTNNPHCMVRTLSKNASMANDLAGFVQYKDRIMPSLSLTAPRSKSYLAQVVEPNASTIVERLDAMKQIHALGYKLFGMCCPAMPGLLTDAIDIEELLDELLCFNPDTIWLEAVNPRGSGLKDTETAFRQAGHTKIADAVMEIRDEKNHDDYVAEFVRTANKVGKKLRCDSKFKFLVYNDLESQLKAFTNVIYLGKPKTPKQAPPATTGLPVPQSTQTAKTTPLAIPDREFEYLDIDLITVDPEVAERSNKKKMDDAFAESIKAHGVLQPILVKKTEEGVILVAGAKRFTTAKSIGLETIPVAYLEDESAPEVSLMENLLRQGLGPIDKAETLHKLNKEGKHQQKSLAAMLGMSPNAVSELIGIGGLPKDIRDICRKEPHLYPIRELKTLVTLTDDAAKRAAFKTLGAKAKAKSNKQPVTFEVRVTTKLVDLVADLKKFKDRRPDAEVFAVMKSGLVSLRNELDEVLALARQEAESAQDDIDASNWSEDAPCMPEYTSATSIVNHETLPLLAIKSEVTPAVKPLAERSLADFIPDFGLEDMEQDGAISERDKGGTAVIDGDEEVQEDKDDSDGEQEVEECSIPVWGDNDDDDLSPEDQALYDALLKDDSFIDH